MELQAELRAAQRASARQLARISDADLRAALADCLQLAERAQAQPERDLYAYAARRYREELERREGEM